MSAFKSLLLLPLVLSLSQQMNATEITQIPFDTADKTVKTLADYEGKVLLLVNVASKCGFTKQYEALEELYRSKKEDGLVVIAFPCNDFGGQEPGTIAEIQEFCKLNYDITFPIMDKIHVKGPDQHPLYVALADPATGIPGEVKWNFEKSLISKTGQVIARYDSKTGPMSPEISAEIERALAE